MSVWPQNCTECTKIGPLQDFEWFEVSRRRKPNWLDPEDRSWELTQSKIQSQSLPNLKCTVNSLSKTPGEYSAKGPDGTVLVTAHWVF